ncbi:hypothetical protein MVEN_01396800 [Mycena venus]|uniref:ER transporter 6TM N-terminal domain-containing protein n=1 Tax=Mycena venus TaxID=2733690 RepID=A0A8H6XWC6_9AGAR|nr:hypothetical protein MVEN_01396800 [Mycena venus]
MAAREPKTSSTEDSSSTLRPETVTEEKPSRSRVPTPAATSHTLLSSLPPWVSGPLHSPRAWKVLLRCWVACLASYIILLPNASLRTIGVTGFFALLTSLLLPPYLPVQLTIFMLSTLCAGLLSGWGIGIGAMRAANAVRNQALIQAAGQQIQASIKTNPVFQANPAIAQTTAVFSGLFLDVRSTAMYGAFLGVGAFIFGTMRAYAPKLIFMSIFGTIALDVFCAVGPLFPSKRYTLLNSMGISVGCYMAIVIVTTLLIFPETMSHAAMDTVSGQLGRLVQLIQIQDTVLEARSEELTRDSPLIRKFRALRAQLIGTQQQLAATSGFLSLEFTYGRWSGDDVRSLGGTLRYAYYSWGLLNFDRLLGTACVAPASPALTAGSTTAPGSVVTRDTYLLRQIHTRNAAREAAHGVRPEDMLPILNAATADLRSASTAALTAVRAIVDLVNTTRWRRGTPARETACAETLDASAAQLRAALAGFDAVGQGALLAPFLPVLRDATPDETHADPPLRALFVAYMFAADALGIARATLVLVDTARALCDKRMKSRLWAPTGLRSLWSVLVRRGDKTDGTFGEDTSAPVKPTPETRNHRRDPDSRPPTNALQRIMNGVHKVYRWAGTAEAVFIFKYVFISLALWLPAVFKHSAHFYYVEKGIWALIMAQTTLNIYAADQIFNYVTRLLGTLVGLGIGLLAWYAGNGKGDGNTYGSAVAVGVFIIPLLFVRIFAPERFLAGNVLCCTTFALVVGYSWIDGHAVQFASPGIGWSVAWKRWALVMAGSLASFILMMFPPKSGRKAVRQRNAASIAVLGENYAFLISTWISSKSKPDSTQELTENATPAPWTADFRSRLMELAEEMSAIRMLTDLAKWEGSIRGKWPAKEYARLLDVQVDMIGSLAQLAGALSHLENDWRNTFVHSSKVLNPNFISDVMAAFSLVSQSLRTGEPLHYVLPANKQEDIEAIKSPGYMYYASGMIAVYQLLVSLDELHAITKELCGEVPLEGFARWREEYEGEGTRVV